MNPTLKFTAKYSLAKRIFLDVPVMKKRNQLVTDLYAKLTDTSISSCYFMSCRVIFCGFVYTSRKNFVFTYLMAIKEVERIFPELFTGKV